MTIDNYHDDGSGDDDEEEDDEDREVINTTMSITVWAKESIVKVVHVIMSYYDMMTRSLKHT